MANNLTRDEPDGLQSLLGAALRGLIAGIIVILILALILSAAALSMDDPASMLEIFAIAALFIGAVVCGFVSAKSYPDAAFIAGLLGGAFYVLFIWVISLFFRGDSGDVSRELVSPLWMALGYIGCIALSMLGGLLGRKRKQRIGDGNKSPAALARRQLKTARR
ncbi:MAG: TIGR04086 family membrane protein [Clostridiales bacterium]|nr:TIGR04086 family membrane protein [Clostridiales bacterium]